MLSLIETGRILSSEVTLNTLLTTILEKACTLTDSPDGSLLLLDEKRLALYFAEAVGANSRLLLERWGRSSAERVPLKKSKAGVVFTTGKSIIEQSLVGDTQHFRGVDRGTRSKTHSMVCVPLIVGKDRLGVVQILNKRSGKYTDRDRTLLEHFAGQAAIALRNARLFEKLLLHMGMYDTHDTGHDPIERVKELSHPARTEVLTVFFADMRGFTRLSDVIRGPEAILELLNEFLGMLADEVVTYKGVVNKFLGDGVMALFRGDDHPVRAVQCAFAIIDAFAELREGWNARTNSPLGFLDIGIGIATDTAIVGSVGTTYVRDFTAIGPAVNLAAYLVEQARQGRRVYVDKKTFLAAQDIISKFEGPEVFELKKPGQATGSSFERYALETLKTADRDKAAGAEATKPSVTKTPKSVFVSYSHKDKAWLKRLQTHLKPYMRGGSLSVWDDTKIKAGSSWREEIDMALGSASVAVLLVSPNFLDSEFIASDELPPLLTAAKSRGLTILWAALSSSSYDETEIKTFQAALEPSKPLDTLSKAQQNKALVKLCKTIKATMQ